MTEFNLEIAEIERIELTGKRFNDGEIEYGGQRMPGWPERLNIKAACGAIVVPFRLEEEDDREEGEDDSEGDEHYITTQAWYVPDTE
jgi:hypothetical protein